MNKSHVGLGCTSCPICGAEHSEVVLLNKRLRSSLPRRQVIDIALCPEHAAKVEEYAALVGIDTAKSTQPYKPATVWRTGEYVHIRRDAWPRIFNVPAPETFAYCDNETIEKLRQTMPRTEPEAALT